MIRKELWFGFSLMAIIIATILIFLPWGNIQNGHLGLLMLALIVVTIMLGFPTAFTLMGMGMFFAWLAYHGVNPELAPAQVLDLMVQRAYGVMSNDVLIAIPLFVFMGYLVERAALIDKLFSSLHLAMSRVPGSLAVATIVTCAIFATATGIVGAVVTLMGLLAFPAMLKAGYNIKVSAGCVTAGGCLGILIPPSVLLIVYGATAGVSVVQLYAGAFFPGLMLAGLYLGYVIVLAKLKPDLMPPLAEDQRRVPLPAYAELLALRGRHALTGLGRALTGDSAGVPKRTVAAQLFVALLPALVIAFLLIWAYRVATAPTIEYDTAGLEISTGSSEVQKDEGGTGLEAPPVEAADPTTLKEPPRDSASTGLAEPPKEPEAKPEEAKPEAVAAAPASKPDEAKAADAKGAAGPGERLPVPPWYWTFAAILVALAGITYFLWTWERFQVFKLLLASFFPLAMLILAVLGSIVFGFATPAEAAAVGAFGGFVLTVAYRFIEKWRTTPSKGRAVTSTVVEVGGILKESSYLTAKTTAMVCWLFVGSAIFSAAFALLGGQELIEKWVLSLDLTPLQFMILAQFIIFILGWPLEWTEIIIIFMPIFIPLLPHFNIDPLFFGLLVALNLQTAFLSPPVAMAAFYLKGVAPRHVTLNQIFAGMMPFMVIQVIALVLLYAFPGIGLWLPQTLYKSAESSERQALMRWTGFGLGVAAFWLSFFHRIAPGAIASELTAAFEVSGAALGALAATYFYIYAVLQVPSGVLADTLGPRKLLAGGSIIAGIGSLIFAGAESLTMAAFGRTLVGLGVASAFICVMKLNANWFDERRFATATGWANFFGILGAFSATAPLAWLVTVLSWRTVFVATGLMSLALGAVTLWKMHDAPRSLAAASRPREPWLTALAVVVRNRATWPTFWVNFGLSGVNMSFIGLWAAPFLTHTYGMSNVAASNHTSLMLAGYGVATVVVGWWSDRVQRRRPILLASTALYLACWGAWLAHVPPGWTYVLALFMGVVVSGFSLAWACAKEVNAPEYAGMATSVANLGGFVAAGILQPLVGWVLDSSAPGDYTGALAVFALFSAAGLAGALFIRETRCRNIWNEVTK